MDENKTPEDVTQDESTLPAEEAVPVEPDPTDLGPVDAPLEQSVNVKSTVTVKTKKPRNKKKMLLVVLAVLLVAMGVGAYYWFVVRDDDKTVVVAPAVEKKQEQTPDEVDEALKKFITPTTGETWLATPKKIASQKYFSYDEGDEVTYYQVGSHDGKTINMSVVCQLGCEVKLYEVTNAGTVSYIARPDSQAVYNQDTETTDKSNLKSTISFDTSTHYDSLSMPASLTIEHDYKVTKPTYPSLGEPIADTGATNKPVFSDVKTYGASKLIRSETSYVDTKLTSIGYGLQTPLGTRVWLGFEPVPTQLKGYQWTSGNSPDSDKLKAIARGCGGLGSSITRSDVLKDGDMQEIGKSSDGQTVYQLKDPNNALLTKAYQEFVEYAGTDSSVPYAGISKTEFIKEHGVVIAKDKFGQMLIYTREQLSPGYGCAKPVVYLYPTTTQSVNVRVGADVKVSEPLYPAATGWQNVIAQPNGQLSYLGHTYGSLFWEGPGYGAYPAVTSGTVVRRADAIATIQAQLAQQGLNATETADFVAYWQDKLPNKPYVRLTWFNTAQLNQLAPLAITPKPDTLIRVFLDFSGLDGPIDLPAQQLRSVPRNGFTVVEWGGLSPYKLY